MGLLCFFRRTSVTCLLFVGLFVITPPAIAQFLSANAAGEPFSYHGITFQPEAFAGYEKLSLNFNLPATLDLQFQDAGLWVGGVGLQVDCPGRLGFAVKGWGNAKKNISVAAREEPYFSSFETVMWTGSKLQWWTLEGSVHYRASAAWSVSAGLRRDHLSVNLTNPRSKFGALNYDEVRVDPFGFNMYSLRYRSDFSSKLWIPYIGLKLRGNKYKASFLVGPYASADTTAPAGILNKGRTESVFFSFDFSQNVTMKYRVHKPAVFLEGDFRYDCPLSGGVNLGLWFTGNYLNLRGDGAWDLSDSFQLTSNVFPGFFESRSASRQDTASYTRSMVGGGVSLAWAF